MPKRKTAPSTPLSPPAPQEPHQGQVPQASHNVESRIETIFRVASEAISNAAELGRTYHNPEDSLTYGFLLTGQTCALLEKLRDFIQTAVVDVHATAELWQGLAYKVANTMITQEQEKLRKLRCIAAEGGMTSGESRRDKSETRNSALVSQWWEAKHRDGRLTRRSFAENLHNCDPRYFDVSVETIIRRLHRALKK